MRARLVRSRAKTERLTRRLETTRAALETARAESEASRATLARAQETSGSLEGSLGDTHQTLAHYMELERQHAERLAQGRAALFDYPVIPRPRTFARPGKDFFG